MDESGREMDEKWMSEFQVFVHICKSGREWMKVDEKWMRAFFILICYLNKTESNLTKIWVSK